MTNRIERPEVVKDEHLEFLDDLRESAMVNMYSATPYLVENFDLSKESAKAVLCYWMETFGNPLR